MKYAWYSFMVLAVVFLATQALRLFMQERRLNAELAEIMLKTAPLAKENERLAHSFEELRDPAAVGRELRRAGYAAPGEKVFIIVPKR